jgi:hypothetical protein
MRIPIIPTARSVPPNGCLHVCPGALACPPRLKLDDQPSSRTASPQPTMGVGRPFRRIELCYAKRDFAGLDQLPEPIELLEFLRVGAHEGRREVDIPLRDTLEAADGRECAAVANGGDDTLIEHGSVRKPIDSLREVPANSRCDIIAPSNDDVGAKRTSKASTQPTKGHR